MRFFALPVAVLAASMLAGCSLPQGQAVTETPPPSPIRPDLRWDRAGSGEGAELVLYDASSSEALLRISCLPDPPRMTIVAERLTPVGSAEELSMGVDEEAFMFVADPTATDVPGVRAEGRIRPDLLSRFEDPRAVGVVYGAQRLGPYIPPDPGLARGFADGCREIAGLPAGQVRRRTGPSRRVAGAMPVTVIRPAPDENEG